MQNTCINFDEIIKLMIKNNHLIKIMQGYCIAFSGNIDEMDNLLTVIETLIANHNSLWDKLDQIEGDVLRLTNPEFFKQ